MEKVAVIDKTFLKDLENALLEDIEFLQKLQECINYDGVVSANTWSNRKSLLEMEEYYSI